MGSSARVAKVVHIASLSVMAASLSGCNQRSFNRFAEYSEGLRTFDQLRNFLAAGIDVA